MTSPTKKALRIRRHARIRAKVSGTVARPRLVIYRSLASTYASLVDDATGTTLASANDLTMAKGTKTERAIAVGQKIAEHAKAKNISAVVFDRAGFQYHGRVKALADAAREKGLTF